MDININMELDKEKIYIGSCCKNSFVVFDCRNIELDKKYKVDLSIKNIIKCKVDSALFINSIKGDDIFVEIFEKDGSESESCGNGAILIAYLLNLNKGTIKFKNSFFIIDSTPEKQIILMDVNFSYTEEADKEKKHLFVNVGEPHIIYLIDDINKFDLVKFGEELQEKYQGGVNFDAIQKIDDFHYLIRTYERGVFAETMSCGTGSLSSYIAISHFNNKIYKEPVEFKSLGGNHLISLADDMLKLEVDKKFIEIKNLS